MPFNNKTKLIGIGGGGWFRSARFGANKDTMYTLGDRNNLYISRDGGMSWTEGRGQLNGKSEDLCVDYNGRDNRLLVACDGGVFFSDDSGETLRYMFDNVPNHDGSKGIERGRFSADGNGCTAVEFNKTNPNKMYAGNGGSGWYWNGTSDEYRNHWLSQLHDWNVWYTSDGGQNWTAILNNQILGQDLKTNDCVYKIRNSWTLENVIYVSTSRKVYKGTETNGSWSWQELPQNGRPGKASFETMDDIDNPNILYTLFIDGTGKNGTWSYPAKNFYKSTDGGNTWVQKGNNMDSSYSCGQEIRFDKSGNGTIWFGNRYPKLSLGNQLYKSTDRGESWQKIGYTTIPENNYGTDSFVATSFDAFGDSVFFVPADTMTKDGGNTWDSTASTKKIVDGKTFYRGRGNEFINTFNLDYVRGTNGLKMFFAAADHKFIESWDGGESWLDTVAGKGHVPFAYPLESQRFNCSLEAGTKNIKVLDYTLKDPLLPDEPENRDYKYFNFSNTYYAKVWDSTTNNNGYYYFSDKNRKGTGPYYYTAHSKYKLSNGFLVSTDWSSFESDGSAMSGPAPLTISSRYIKVSPHNENDIYVCLYNQSSTKHGILMRTNNGGTDWQVLQDSNYPEEEGNARGIYTMEVNNDGTIFALFHYVGIYRSIDKGNSWTKLYSGADKIRGAGGGSTTGPNGYMYFGVRYPGSGEDPLGVYRSIDGGSTWQQFTNGLKPYGSYTNITGIAVDPSNPNIVWCSQQGTNGGIYRSLDYGENWELVFRPDYDSEGYPIPAGQHRFIGITVDPIKPDHVYTGTQDDESDQFFYGQGIWKTENGTATSGVFFDYIPVNGNHSSLGFGANWGSSVRKVYTSVDQKCAYAIYADETTEITTAPVLNSQIEDKIVTEGFNVSFFANFSYADSYQWYEDGIAISGATNSTYTVTNALIEQNGNIFRCDASNNLGTTQSNDATLIVNPAGANIPNAPSNCTATVSGTTITVDWDDNSNNEDGFELEINGSSSYIVLAANQTQYLHQDLSNGTYNYRVRSYNNDGNSSWSNTATATINTTPDYSVQWTNDGLKIDMPANIDSTLAANKIISACKTSGEFSFEAWVIPNQESYSYLSRLATICPDGNERNFLFSQQDDQFNLVVRTSNSDEFGNDPTSNPAKGGNVNINLMHIIATYDGTWRRIYIDGSLAFEDNTALGDLSTWDDTYLLSLGNTVNGDSTYAWYGEFKTMAFYSVALTPSEVTQNYNEGYITKIPEGTAPTITDQTVGPVNIDEGDPLELYVTAQGNPTPSYQWYKDNIIISGETEPNYIVGITSIGDEGSYHCKVSNGVSPDAVSNPIDVYINVDGTYPRIIDQPSNQRVAISPDGLNVETAIFEVAATGDNITYQWYKDGIALQGETAPVLQYPNSTPADDGSVFMVVVTNENGSEISDEAILSVYSTTLNILPPNFEYIIIDEGSIMLKWLEPNTVENDINYEIWASRSGLYGEYFKIADVTSGTYTYTDIDFSGPGETKWYYINSYVPETGEVSQASERISGTMPGGIIGKLSVVGPDSVSVSAGSNAKFSVNTAGGKEPFTYTWYQDDKGVTLLVITGPDPTSVSQGENATFVVNVTGGTEPYTYIWYQDDQEIIIDPLNVLGPNPTEVEEGTNATFNVNVTGGTEPYTYTWYQDDISTQ